MFNFPVGSNTITIRIIRVELVCADINTGNAVIIAVQDSTVPVKVIRRQRRCAVKPRINEG